MSCLPGQGFKVHRNQIKQMKKGREGWGTPQRIGAFTKRRAHEKWAQGAKAALCRGTEEQFCTKCNNVRFIKPHMREEGFLIF